MINKGIAGVLILCSHLLAANVNATADLADVTITTLHFNKALGDFLFIRTSEAPTVVGCQTDSNWNLVLPIETGLDNKIYAGLLAAKAAQTKVHLRGSGTCSPWGIEYLDTISIN